jgi:MFS transporter, DHA2 family, multidrug resistance protein
VGVAIVGSILTSIYVRTLDPETGALDPARADKARGSLKGALEVSDTLPASADSALTAAARDAFERGATAAYAVVAVLALLAAAAAWLTLGRAGRGDEY